MGHGRTPSFLRLRPFVNSSFSIAGRAYPCRPDCAYSETRRTFGHSGCHKTTSTKTVLSYLQFGGDCHSSKFRIWPGGRLSKIEQLWINISSQTHAESGRL